MRWFFSSSLLHFTAFYSLFFIINDRFDCFVGMGGKQKEGSNFEYCQIRFQVKRHYVVECILSVEDGSRDGGEGDQIILWPLLSQIVVVNCLIYRLDSVSTFLLLNQIIIMGIYCVKILIALPQQQRKCAREQERERAYSTPVRNVIYTII